MTSALSEISLKTDIWFLSVFQEYVYDLKEMKQADSCKHR